MSSDGYKIRIVANSYVSLLLAVALTLIAIHTVLYLYNNRVEELPWLLLQLFDLDEENNIPTWFSSFILLNNSLATYLLSQSFSSRMKSYWLFLAAGFFVLSIDEVAGLHETLNSSIDMNWAIPGAFVVVIVGSAFVPFLLSLRRRLAFLLLLSGFVYVSGAIVVELLSEDMDSYSSAYALAVALEEGLEMLGALLCLNTVLGEMKRNDRLYAHLSVI